jgi:hypothetical protein
MQTKFAKNTEAIRGGIGYQPKDTLELGNKPLAAERFVLESNVGTISNAIDS